MIRILNILFVLLIVFFCGTLIGCSGSSGSSNPEQSLAGSPTAKQGLIDLAELLKEIEASKKKTPAKISDVEPYEPVHQGAYLALVQGQIVYLWGSSVSSGTSVIAYEKVAESAGGYVLLQDGTVKSMTADEFKAAPKAAKK